MHLSIVGMFLLVEAVIEKALIVCKTAIVGSILRIKDEMNQHFKNA